METAAPFIMTLGTIAHIQFAALHMNPDKNPYQATLAGSAPPPHPPSRGGS
jgi:hypothetical protein